MMSDKSVLLRFAAGLLAVWPGIAASQPPDSLRLEDLQAALARNWPAARQASIADQLSAVRLEAIASVWMPEVTLSATAQYQTDVTEIRLPIPGANPPSQPKDRYSLAIDVRQVIWDGGMSRTRAEIEDWARQADKTSMDVDLYALAQPLTDAFFSALMLAEQRASLDLYLQDLDARLSQTTTAIEAGAAASTQRDVLQVEILRLRQRLAETERHLERAYELMALLSGTEIDRSRPLALPRPVPGAGRPETTLMQARIGQLEATRKSVDASRRPVVSAFATGAYARPGLDLFDDAFAPFAVVGIRASWPVWDRGASRRESRTIALQQERIRSQWDALNRQWAIQAASKQAEMDRLDAAMALDAEILRLRRQIVDSYARQLDAGAITATEFLVERNALHQAEIQSRLHRLLKRQAEWSLALITGG
jgi:outer membrane protein TolC